MWLFNRIEKNEIPEFEYERVNTLHFIHRSYLTKQKLFQDNIRDNYYTYKEASHILLRPETSLSESVGKGLFKDVLHFCGRSYISKNEIDKYKELTKDTISRSVIEDELNLSTYQALKLINNEPQLEANLVSNSFYVKKIVTSSLKNVLIIR